MSTLVTVVTGREESDLTKQQIYNYRAHAESEGVTIHDTETPIGAISFTFDGIDTDGAVRGRIWATDGVTVNRTEHDLLGHYRNAKVYGRWMKSDHGSGMTWQLYDDPYCSIDGYPGIRRADGGSVTDNARTKIGVTLGKAIADYMRGSDFALEALVNQREIAARHWDHKARYEREKAQRHLDDAAKHEAEAARIRAGGDYEPIKR